MRKLWQMARARAWNCFSENNMSNFFSDFFKTDLRTDYGPGFTKFWTLGGKADYIFLKSVYSLPLRNFLRTGGE